MQKYYDVVCVGGGGAGVTAAITASALGAKVALLSKEPVGGGDTKISFGAMAYPGVSPGDSPEKFYCDLIKSGEGLADKELVKTMAERGRRAVSIAENQGLLFWRDSEGLISQKVAGFTGGHTFPRTVSTLPGGGVAYSNALRAATARSNVEVYEDTVVYRIYTAEGRVCGVACLDLASGESFVIRCPAVVLAGGGGGWLFYPHTDNNRGQCADSLALAFAAGAELVDLEQVQFIPFGLTHPGSMVGVFLGEPNIAAPGGILLNAAGDLLLRDLHRLNRAEVTRTMALALSRGEGSKYGGLLLDLSPNLKSEEGRSLWKFRADRGQLDVLRWTYGEKAFRWEEPLDVAPTVHYLMGGIKVDARGQSSLPGLFAAGQAAGGLHGGNRLGSVSLAEIYIFGEIAGQTACRWAQKEACPELPADQAGGAGARIKKMYGMKGKFSPAQLTAQLQELMWQAMGPAREAQTLSRGYGKLLEIARLAGDPMEIPQQQVYNLSVLEALELEGMIAVAGMMIQSALAREETRGAHLRLDYPRRDDQNWQCRLVWRQTPDGPAMFREEAGGC